MFVDLSSESTNICNYIKQYVAWIPSHLKCMVSHCLDLPIAIRPGYLPEISVHKICCPQGRAGSSKREVSER